MNFWEELLLKVVPIVFTSTFAYFIGRLNKKADKKVKDEECAMKKMNAIEKGMQSILRIRLIEYHDKYMKKGSIPVYAFDNFKDVYEAYHDLGGNGTGTHMFEDIQKLPIQ